MPIYHATIRIDGLRGDNAREVRDALEAKLAKAEIEDCRVMSVEQVNRNRSQPSVPPARVAPAEGAWRRQSNAGGLVLILAIGWAVWFFWSYFSLYLEAY